MLICRGTTTVLAAVIATVSAGTLTADTLSAADLDDEFTTSKSLSSWKNRDSVEGGRKTYDKVAIGASRKGWLTIVPRPGNGWYKDGMGPMLYKELEGDFLVETRVATESRNASGKPPRAQYNSAGLIVPRSGCSHRARASNPAICPVLSDTIGW